MILEIADKPTGQAKQFWIYLNKEDQKNGSWRGSGWITNNVLRIRKCPRCDAENYPIQEAAVGSCYACGFDANVEFAKEIENEKTTLDNTTS